MALILRCASASRRLASGAMTTLTCSPRAAEGGPAPIDMSCVDADKIEANFKNGVLTSMLPKTTQAQKNEKKIAIKKA